MVFSCGASKAPAFATADDDGGPSAGGGDGGANGGGGSSGGASSSGASSSGGLRLGDASTGVRSCSKDSDCNGTNPCVTYSCPQVSGEIAVRTCVLTSMSDAGACLDAGSPAVDAGGLPPIDPMCMGGGLVLPEFPPAVPLLPPDVPSSCSNGFEIGDATPGSKYTLMSKTAAGSRAITLDVDFATYLQADGVVVTGTGPSGATYTLLDTCRLQTSILGDPTGGKSRPPDNTLRQFRIQVEQGTTQLVFDFSGVVSPMYIQVLGLCDFNVTQDTAATWWQTVP
jgi:hypothetical protein